MNIDIIIIAAILEIGAMVLFFGYALKVFSNNVNSIITNRVLLYGYGILVIAYTLNLTKALTSLLA